MADKPIRNVNSRIYSLPLHVYKHQLDLYEQHIDSFKIIRINTEGKTLIRKSDQFIISILSEKSVL